jgi:hypothetical protein
VTVALLLAAASAYAQPFWARDLGAAARAVSEDEELKAGDTDRLFFADLISLCSCRPLPAVTDEPLRLLLRAELARRARLKTAQTVWRDIERPDFFRRDAGNPRQNGRELRWPQEVERWSDEQLLVADPVSNCTAKAVPGDELAPLTNGLLEKLGEDPRYAATLSRTAFVRGVLLLRKGQRQEARLAAGHAQPDLLEPALASFGRLLRLDLGIDPPEGWVAMARDRSLGEAQTVAMLRATDVLMEQDKFSEAIALVQTAREAPLTSQGLDRVLRYRLALLQLRAGQTEGALDTVAQLLPRTEPGALADATDEIALRASAASKDPAAALERATLLLGGRVQEPLARHALARGNYALASEIARRYISAGGALRFRGLSLLGRIAFARDDQQGFADVAGKLLPQLEPVNAAGTERLLRTTAAIEVLDDAVAGESGAPRPGWRGQLQAALAAAKNAVSLHALPVVDRLDLLLTAAPRAVPEVSLGRIAVDSKPVVVPLPAELPITYPEPFSLLAIPASDGTIRSWFERP